MVIGVVTPPKLAFKYYSTWLRHPQDKIQNLWNGFRELNIDIAHKIVYFSLLETDTGREFLLKFFEYLKEEHWDYLLDSNPINQFTIPTLK